MDNPNVIVRSTTDRGLGVFAVEAIEPGDLIASFDGQRFASCDDDQLPPSAWYHAIQYGPNCVRDSAGIARVVNHSCEPNCGIRRLFDIVCMKPIAPGEEVFWDYAMSENSDWAMDCVCGTPSCRKKIIGFRGLDDQKIAEYEGYISAWLVG